MKNTKPRNREHRTRSAQAGTLVTIHDHIPREAYDQMQNMERRKMYTQDGVFLLGLRATETM